MSDHSLYNWLSDTFAKGSYNPGPLNALSEEEREIAKKVMEECNKVKIFENYSKIYLQALNGTERYYEMSIRALSALIKVGNIGREVKEIDALCKNALDVFSQELEFENCSIMLKDEEGEHLILVAGRGRGDRFLENENRQREMTIKIGEGIAGKVVQTGEHIFIADVKEDKRFKQFNKSVNISSILSIPVKNDEGTIGVINFSHPFIEAFDANIINLMLLLSNFVGQMITLARLHNRIANWNENLNNEIREKTNELRATNRKLRELNDNLVKRVEEEVRIRRQKEELLIQQSKMAAMGEMINVIAHQWKQPLNAVSAIAQDIMDAYEYHEADESYIKESVDKIMLQTGYMSHTIDDFRSFFVPSKQKSSFDIKVAIEEVLKLFSCSLANRMIFVKIKCRCHKLSKMTEDIEEIGPCDLSYMTVSGYPNEFKHVVLNLLNNSGDAIANQKQKGFLSKESKGFIEINLSLEKEGIIRITITDNGGGIGEEIIEKIFDPYFSTKTTKKGTGIGLYMSKVIIENNMGGKLYVENGDMGAVFTIELNNRG